ncbi:MAG: PD-(D/E)XK nuclease family protein [Methylocystis sp.]
MPAWQNFSALHIPPTPTSTVRPRFSLTSDILSFRRCSRQYGYFGNDGFVPAQATQIFYGTVIHQVLDRCHRHYWGLAGHAKGTMPADDDIDAYFSDVQNALRSHGVRPASPEVARKARRVLKVFNRVEGPALYPLIRDTEFRLESERADYVLRGVVDVLARNMGAPDDPAQMEIWDYKGTRRPDQSSTEMRDYRWQMCVYAELYRAREGVYPARAILYFLNELDQDPVPTTRPLRAVCEVTFTPESVQQALQEFDTTATAIIGCRSSATWGLPAGHPGKETCDICDIRWNCPHPQVSYPARMPIS